MSSNSAYFSNHSQRFTPQAALSPSVQPPVQPPPPQKSSHFSSKVLQSANSTVGESTIHPLRHTWVLWFQHRAPGSKTTNYESGIKRISSFSSIESFWSLFTHLNAPSRLAPTTDYLLFHSAVRRPVWEDPVNERGGKWIVRLKKGVADRVWEEIVLAVIGDQFAPERGSVSVENDGWEVCGVSISVRSNNEDILAVWHKTESDEAVKLRIRDIIKRVLQLSPATVLEYKTNNDSMQDKSSFRTTPTVERPTPS